MSGTYTFIGGPLDQTVREVDTGHADTKLGDIDIVIATSKMTPEGLEVIKSRYVLISLKENGVFLYDGPTPGQKARFFDVPRLHTVESTAAEVNELLAQALADGVAPQTLKITTEYARFCSKHCTRITGYIPAPYDSKES